MAICHRSTNAGFTLIEILVALVVLLVGLMGAAGLMVRTVQQEAESYQRLQALNVLQDQTYRITVAWQGLSETVTATENNTCGKDLYGDEKLRRIVSAIIRIGDLS